MVKKIIQVEADMSLDREELGEAISDGVKRAFIEMGSNYGRFDVPHELLFDAIREGTYQAIWHMITSGTAMPCADFYDTVGRAVEKAVRELKLREDDA